MSSVWDDPGKTLFVVKIGSKSTEQVRLESALPHCFDNTLEGFIDGLFNGQDRIDLPERAHQALGHLGELRAMMAGIEDLVARDVEAESRIDLEVTFKHVRELTRIMETEIHEAVLSCTRARRQMLEGVSTENPTLH